jgi:hypothetical protein
VIRRTVRLIELIILSVLILGTRCANYQDVFVGGNTFFIDGDCYARMTRVRMCLQHPGLVVRHHDFENFPQGTAPHTTVPLDYLILGLAILLKPFTSQSVDLAGAMISPVLALLGGVFLCWWSLRMKLRFRWTMLILFAISPILVHGSALGRPDHQSVTLILSIVGICSKLSLAKEFSRSWSVLNGFAWGLAIWVSSYEPLILLTLILVIGFCQSARSTLSEKANDKKGPNPPNVWVRAMSFLTAKYRWPGWVVCATILLVALAIERRVPSLTVFRSNGIFENWSRTIGELLPVSPFNPIWFHWCGWLILAPPFLIWFYLRQRNGGRSSQLIILVLLLATFGLTIWQARWAYFFVAILAIALPNLFAVVRSRVAVWIVFAISLFPILRDWDENIWPNEPEAGRRIEQRHEGLELRELALNMMSSKVEPFLAPWWISPAIAYWSGQPGVAGTSHESLPGIRDSAQLFLAERPDVALDILTEREVVWVVGYDADRVEKNSAAILGVPVSNKTLSRLLEQKPTQVPRFLRFSAQNGTGKLYRVGNNR